MEKWKKKRSKEGRKAEGGKVDGSQSGKVERERWKDRKVHGKQKGRKTER